MYLKMVKLNIFSLIIILSNITFIITKTNLIDDVLDDYDIKYEEYLNKFFLNYLDSNNLIESDQLISQSYMKKIIVDIMLEGLSPNEVEENILTMYNDLADIFIEKYYKERKEIKGKDLINIINIKELMQKYYELNGESPIYDDDYIFNDDNLNIKDNADFNNDFDL